MGEHLGDAVACTADAACDLLMIPVLGAKGPHAAATWDEKPLAEGPHARMARATIARNIQTRPRPGRTNLGSPAGTALAFPGKPLSRPPTASLHPRHGGSSSGDPAPRCGRGLRRRHRGGPSGLSCVPYAALGCHGRCWMNLRFPRASSPALCVAGPLARGDGRKARRGCIWCNGFHVGFQI
jgi:hypothetical protein